MARRDTIINAVTDAAAKLLYYDRKEDEDLGVGEIAAAIRAGEVTVDEILAAFRVVIEEELNH